MRRTNKTTNAQNDAQTTTEETMQTEQTEQTEQTQTEQTEQTEQTQTNAPKADIVVTVANGTTDDDKRGKANRFLVECAEKGLLRYDEAGEPYLPATKDGEPTQTYRVMVKDFIGVTVNGIERAKVAGDPKAKAKSAFDKAVTALMGQGFTREQVMELMKNAGK